MPTLAEDRIWRQPERFERPHQTGGLAEGTLVLDVEHLHHRQPGRGRAVDQRLLTRNVGAEIVVPEIGAVPERLLGIDDEKRGIGHVGSPAGGCR